MPGLKLRRISIALRPSVVDHTLQPRDPAVPNTRSRSCGPTNIRLMLSLIFALLIGSAPAAVAQTLPFQGSVKGSSVNLRSGPGTEHAVVGTAENHQSFSVLERKLDWYRVRPTRLTIAAAAITPEGKVKAASVLEPAELGYKVKAGEQLGLYQKPASYDRKILVFFPQAPSLWIHSQFIVPDPYVRGVPETAWARVSASPIRAEDFATLAKLREKGGLRYVCLPTSVPSGYVSGTPSIDVKETGARDVMLTPSYELKFSKGTSWFSISALLSDGAADGEEPFYVETPQFGALHVSRWVHDRSKGPYWVTGVRLVGAFVPRTIAGPANTSQSVPQSIGIEFSPDFTREQMTTILNSLRLVKLQVEDR